MDYLPYIEQKILEHHVVTTVAYLEAWWEKMRMSPAEVQEDGTARHLQAEPRIRNAYIVSSFLSLHEWVFSGGKWPENPYGTHAADAVQDAGEFLEIARAYGRATGRGGIPNPVIEQIFERAEARFWLEEEVDDLSLRQVALLANMTEQGVRNSLRTEKKKREIPTYIDDEGRLRFPVSEPLRDWLRKRRLFRKPPRLVPVTLPAQRKDGERTFPVPIAADGSLFHPGLKRRKGYTIGKKGEEMHIEDYEEALDALRKMTPPRWRRPSAKTGVPGIVTGVGWKEMTLAELEAYAAAQAMLKEKT